MWLATLAECGISVDAYLAHELEAHPGRIIQEGQFPRITATGEDMGRIILTDYSEERGYMVGWEWASDLSSADLLVDEFYGLAWNSSSE